MWSRVVCFIIGHKKGRKISTNGDYTSYVCDRCGVNYSVKS